MYKYQTQWKYLLFEVTDDFNQGLHLVDLVVYFYNMKTVLGLRSSLCRHPAIMWVRRQTERYSQPKQPVLWPNLQNIIQNKF